MIMNYHDHFLDLSTDVTISTSTTNQKVLLLDKEYKGNIVLQHSM